MAKKPKKAEAKQAEPRDETDDAFIKEAIDRYDRAYEREEDNFILAYDDLDFLSGNQWPDAVKQEREEAFRPVLTINRLPQFVRQVTGDIRQMRPAIKCVPVDNRGDKETAEVLAGMIRYIENRSDAEVAYTSGADSQVACGVGHWRVTHEYAEETTFNQELRITAIPDGVSIAWDPDSILPNKEDAMFCFVPVDMSRAAYEKAYPDAPITDFVRETFGKESTVQWDGEDFVRVAEYWEKRPEKRTLAVLPDGSIDDLTDETDQAYLAELKARGARIEKRDGFCVYRSLVTLGYVLEKPVKWPGRYIPIVRAHGEEYRVGRKIVRHGVVRFAKDPQRAYNYFRSTQTEVVALQPKAPFIGTDKNFEGLEAQWTSANTKNWPYLTYNPDSKNNGAPPQRSGPGVSLAGVEEGMLVSSDEMKATTGLYDASLGNRSNETSGKAILARQREGDVGTFVYISNFSRAIRHTGRILVDLIPHIYDTERQIRIIGADGKEDLIEINKPMLDQSVDVPEGEEAQAIGKVQHDVTVGAYDVVLETGPSYSTKRAEARDSMIEFMRSAPDIAPLVLDLVAEAQDWPGADKFAKRVKHVLPPAIRAEEAQEAGEPIPQDIQQGQQPNPADLVELQGKQLDNQGKQLTNAGKELDLAAKKQGMVHAEVKAMQPEQPKQQPAPQPAQGTVTEQEFQHFAQIMFSAVEQLQAQLNQLAQMQAPPIPQEPQFIPPEQQPGQAPGF